MLSISSSRSARSPSADRASILATKGVRKDSRPITDKAFQVQMMRKIENYFHVIKQSSILNANGSIKPLTIKMFVDVSGLLVGLLGAKQTLNNVNYVEEMPKIAKKLQYPGQMSKAWLKTVNAMHAMPNALAWMSWLVELCELRDLALEQLSLEDLPFSNINEQAERNREMFLSIMSFYTAWNNCVEQEEALIDEFLKKEEARYGVSDETLEEARTKSEIAEKEQEKEDKLRAKIDLEFTVLKDNLASLIEDAHNIDDYILKMDEREKILEAEYQKLENDISVLRNDIEENLKLQEQLRITISKQPFSAVERDKIVAKCEQTRKFLKEFNNHLEEIQKDIYSRDIKLSKANDDLTKVLLKYNRDVHNSLDGIPDVDILEIQIPEYVSSTQSMEILQNVSLNITKLKERKQKELEEVNKLIKSNEIQLEDSNEKIRTLTENDEEFKRELKEKEAKIKQVNDQGKIDETELRENVKKLEGKFKVTQESQIDLLLIQREFDESIDKRDSTKRYKDHLEKRACSFFNNFYSLLAAQRAERAEIMKIQLNTSKK